GNVLALGNATLVGNSEEAAPGVGGVKGEGAEEDAAAKAAAPAESPAASTDEVDVPSEDSAGAGAGQGGGGAGGSPGRAEHAESAKARIVEGQAEGQASYQWFGPTSWMLLLLALMAFVAIAFLRFFRRPSAAAKNKDKVAPVASAEDDSYDSDEIFVFRGNLSSNHPPLITEKITHILGDVDGASIIAAHKLVIKGSFQGATLKAEAHVTIAGGINGHGKGRLEIGDGLDTTYINEVSIFARGDIRATSAVRNSRIACAGMVLVESKSIVGGSVAAFQGVNCAVLGSDFAETTILLGIPVDAAWKMLGAVADEALKTEEEGEDDWGSTGEEESDLKSPAPEEEASEETEAFAPEDINPKAKLRVYNEIVSAKIVHGEAELMQKSTIPGPVETRREVSNPRILKLGGFRRD
ncbi:MAG: DUF342 domain-containing protein, partial [Planctomycetes bacterium]|nr:DUF342 domain-containing protein [Planctomycetota bacterium]